MSYQIRFDPTAGRECSQPETIPTDQDAALATRVSTRIAALRAEKETKLASLAATAAAAEREERFFGSGARVAGTLRDLARDIEELERHERYLVAAHAGLTSATLATDLDRLRAVEEA
jgi:hypothetical protein